MKKFTVEMRKVLNDELLGDEVFNTLEEAMSYAKQCLEYSRNNYRTNKGEQYCIYSDEYNEDDEIIDNTYKEYLNITTDDYYNMEFDDREKLFNYDDKID